MFKAALRIPNLLQNLLGEGVLSASFIPVYSRLLDEDRRDAERLAGNVARAAHRASWPGSSPSACSSPGPLTMLITPGFSGERLELAVTLLRIMFPGIGFLVLSAFCTGILNSHRHFFLSYVSPVMWNAAQIALVVAVGIVGATEVGHRRTRSPGACSSAGCSRSPSRCPSVRRLTTGATPVPSTARSPDGAQT